MAAISRGSIQARNDGHENDEDAVENDGHDSEKANPGCATHNDGAGEGVEHCESADGEGGDVAGAELCCCELGCVVSSETACWREQLDYPCEGSGDDSRAAEGQEVAGDHHQAQKAAFESHCCWSRD